MNPRILFVILSFGSTVFLNPYQTKAQSNQNLSSSELVKKIEYMDSLLFYAFNTCDINLSKSLFTKDLEFYHDAGGLTNYAQNVNSILQRCSRETKVRRELVKGSFEVYPIKDFGAIQIGSIAFIIRRRAGRKAGWNIQICSHLEKYKWRLENLACSQLRPLT